MLVEAVVDLTNASPESLNSHFCSYGRMKVDVERCLPALLGA